MKKLILVTLLVIIIPFLFVNIFVKTDEIKFKYVTNNIIRVKDEKTGVINEVPFEEYIKGVVAGEMPATFELEALKAQAVASRSYAMYQMTATKDKEYDVLNTTANHKVVMCEYLLLIMIVLLTLLANVRPSAKNTIATATKLKTNINGLMLSPVHS